MAREPVASPVGATRSAPPEPPATDARRVPGRGSAPATDALILAAEPSADAPIRISEYDTMTTPPAAPPRRTPERLTLFLLRLLAGVLLGGAVMLATTRWTHLEPAVVKDTFLAVLIAVVTLVAAAAGFSYGASASSEDGRPGQLQR